VKASTQFTRFILVLLVAATLGVGGCRREQPAPTATPAASIPTPPQVTVSFGMLPYGDHTYAIIGVKKGWFHEVGIDLQYRAIKVEDAVPFVYNGSLDVASCSPGLIAPASETNPGVVNFVFGDIFQGFAIMAQPNKGYKSVQDFIKTGLSPEEAVRAAAAQIRGKVFAYPAEAAIKPFVALALQKGGLTRRDFKARVLDDPLTITWMRDKRAEFQVGGVPSHLVLAREGFKPILTSSDLAAAARPSPDSEELASIFTDGWGCKRDYYNKNKPTILRLASVNFRIVKFINDSPDEALAIHMPYLSQVTGQKLSPEEGRVFYTSLDPFYTFEAQRPWYHDPQSPYYYKHLNGAIINSFVKQGGVFTKAPPQVTDVLIADEIYFELERLKSECDKLFGQIEKAGGSGSDGMRQARAYYDAYDYYDAEAVARALVASLPKTP
jgi:ABC-type nitrate/sulfonate/bicarbonate transport system substrate-binding protein